jgi:hypothetical protein
MDNTIDVAAAEVMAYLGSPELLMKFAEEGHLSKLTLASLLEPDSRDQFLEACAAIEKRFTEECSARGDYCLEDGCAMDGEVCLQALLKAGSAFQMACAAEWIRMFKIDDNRIAAWRS